MTIKIKAESDSLDSYNSEIEMTLLRDNTVKFVLPHDEREICICLSDLKAMVKAFEAFSE